MLDRYRLMPHKLLPYLDADDGTGSGGAGGDEGDEGGEGTQGGGGAERTLTQAEVDRLVAREKRKAAEAERKRIEEEATKAGLTEVEKLKSDLAERDKAIATATERANRRAISSEAQVQALAAGIRADRVAAAIRLADLSDIECDDDGEPDVEAIKSSIATVLKTYPEWAATASGEGGGVGSGAKPASGGGGGEKNPWLPEHFNLTEQARILRENPDRAAKLRAAAGR